MPIVPGLTRAEFVGTDRFVVQRRLGVGGMGEVYEVVDRVYGNHVALKKLLRVDPQNVYQLKQEFRALQGVQHPNLVRLGELIEHQGVWFFTMELVEGVDLVSYVRPGGTLDESRLRSALAQLASGLTALHGAGKVHRDIKPQNVLVTHGGRVVLVDFGLMAEQDVVVETDEQSARFVGTAAYMAPEQAAIDAVHAGVDWYSFGVVLYQALTGRLPYEGRTAIEVLMKKQRYAPAPPRACAEQVPRDLDDLCVDLLSIDPAARPGGRAVLERLGVDLGPSMRSASSSSRAGTRARFVGRDAELEQLQTALAQTRSRGQPVTVFVYGQSGVGKSSLIQSFSNRVVAAEPRTVVLAGRCYQSESVPYKAFDGVIDSLSGAMRRMSKPEAAELVPNNGALLPRVFPVLGRVEAIAQAPAQQPIHDPQELRHRAFLGLRELFYRLAERGPTIVIIDDLQWADAESLLLLTDLTRPPGAPRLLFLISSRGEQTDAEHERAVLCEVRRVHLESLGPEAARALVRLLLEDAQVPVDATANPDAIAGEALGHPLFIDELVRHLAIGGPGERRSLRLDEAIWDRVRQLPPSAALVLELVAAAGAPLPQATIREASELSGAEFSGGLSLLRVANLVRGRSSRENDLLETYHDRIREAVLANLDRDRMRARHRRLAIAIEGTGIASDRPELVLGHLQAAGQIEKAAGYAVDAARRANAALAFEHAGRLYGKALELGTFTAEQARDLQMRRGEALANAGRGSQAAAAYLLAAEGAHPALRRECRTMAASQLLTAGHIEPGLAATREVLAEVGARLPATPNRALWSLLKHRARLRLRGLRWIDRHEQEIAPSALARLDVYRVVSEGLSLVDTIRGADFQARGLLLALQLGERSRIARALSMEAMYLASQGGRGFQRGRALAAEVTRIAATIDEPFVKLWADGVNAVVDYLGGEFRAALERLAVVEAGFRELPTGYSWELNTIRLMRLLALRWAGMFRDQQQLFREYLSDAERRGDRFAETTIRRVAHLMFLGLDRPDEALDNLERSAWTPPEQGFHMQHWYELEARAQIAMYRKTVAEEVERLRPSFAALERSMLLRIEMLRVVARWLWGKLAVVLAAGGTDRERWLKEAARAAHRLRGERIAYARSGSLLLLASIEWLRGNADGAIALLADCERGCGEIGLDMGVVMARLRRGQLIGGAEGAALIADAGRWFDREQILNRERLADTIAPGFVLG
jgi:eukaryotic-like serine/threonine-protein kinase